MARLIVLWLLAERELSGYDIRRALDGDLRLWFELEDGSIYSVLNTLTRRGWVTETGEHTQRGAVRYRITAAGRDEYRRLLRHALTNVPSGATPLDVALAATGDLPEREVAELLRERRSTIERTAAEIEAGRRSAPSGDIADRRRSMLAAELAWLDRRLSDPRPTRRRAAVSGNRNRLEQRDDE